MTCTATLVALLQTWLQAKHTNASTHHMNLAWEHMIWMHACGLLFDRHDHPPSVGEHVKRWLGK